MGAIMRACRGLNAAGCALALAGPAAVAARLLHLTGADQVIPLYGTADEALLVAARRAAVEHQDQHGQPITRDALRARLGVSNQAASELLRQLRAGEGLPPGASRAA